MSPAEVVALTVGRPPTLGSGRLICVDGPAGSGKTTLATQLGAPVVHMDDLYPGWDGLAEVEPHVVGLLEPLSRDQPGPYRRYDWLAGEYAEEHVVHPAPLLVLEGVGSGGLAWSPWITTLVWVEAPYELRIQRGLDRDGEAFAPHWQRWALQERELFAREHTRQRADVVVLTE